MGVRIRVRGNRNASPAERTMYMRVTCPVCEGKGTVADPEVPQVAETCDACGGAGFTAPQAVQAWEYPTPSRLKRLWNRHKRDAAVVVLGVLCGILGALVADLLLGVW